MSSYFPHKRFITEGLVIVEVESTGYPEQLLPVYFLHEVMLHIDALIPLLSD